MRSFGSSHARGRRSVPRAQAPLLAVLSTPLGQHRTTLIDISRTGARLGGDSLPEVGEQLTFEAADVQVGCDVVWREADLCAVEFETPIAAPEVLRLQSLGSLSCDGGEQRADS